MKIFKLFARLFKLFFSVSFFIFFLLFLFLLIDLTDIDKNYINRNLISVDVKNLNSSKSFKLINHLRNYYFYYYEFLSPKKFNNRWSVENESERLRKPFELVTISKKENFSDSAYDYSSYETKNNWFRSHANYFSTRFSELDNINLDNVAKLTLAWKYTSEEPVLNKEVQANAIFYNGRIFTADINNRIISLDGKNGEVIWSYQVKEGIAARRGLIIWDKGKDNLPRLFFTNNRDKLFALNADDGKLINNFGSNGIAKIDVTPLPPIIYKNEIIVINTVSEITSLDLYSGKINWKYKINKSTNSLIFENFKKGSPWGGLSLDEKRGILFFTTGNPDPWYVGVDREGDNLYANSLVAFDLNKREILWHFQEIPHDVWNMDIAAPPILTMIKRNGKYTDVVVAVSKLGNTLIFDRETGEPIFDIIREIAPISNIPGERTSHYQTNIKLPEPICRNKFNKEMFFSTDQNDYDDLFINSTFGFPTPPHLGKKNIQIGACVRWAGASIDTKNSIMYVSSDQAASVIIITEDNQIKFKYYHKWEDFKDSNGYPLIEPPWGSITALDLNTGKIIWKIPFGEYEELTKKGLPITGTPNRSGVTATKGNLIFASGTPDNKSRAFNSINGKEMWQYKLDAPGSSPPTIYSINNKQYILISAFENGGTSIYSFSLDSE